MHTPQCKISPKCWQMKPRKEASWSSFHYFPQWLPDWAGNSTQIPWNLNGWFSFSHPAAREEAEAVCISICLYLYARFLTASSCVGRCLSRSTENHHQFTALAYWERELLVCSGQITCYIYTQGEFKSTLLFTRQFLVCYHHTYSAIDPESCW